METDKSEIEFLQVLFSERSRKSSSVCCFVVSTRGWFGLVVSKTHTVGPYSGEIVIVTLANTVSIAQICVPFAEIQKLVWLKHSSRDLCSVCTQQGLSCLTFLPLQDMNQLVLRSIRPQICTWEQIFTCESFFYTVSSVKTVGCRRQAYIVLLFLPKLSKVQMCSRYSIVGAWLTKPVVLCLK